ncbi:MAG: TIGR04211 family SH3 domain-containing protein [Desulfuromonas sp.]|nr:MAG: TIGR04211 family SH3 domain-containing protein [Desulfuromonas sp.]
MVHRFLTVVVLALLGFSLTPSNLPAETRYVSDRLILILRSEPSDQATAMARLASDEAVEILSENGRFVKVRTQDGTEGFIKTQYLTTELPKTTTIASLQKRIDSLERKLAKTAELSRSSEKQADAINRLQQQVNSEKENRKELQQRYDALVDDSEKLLDIIRERDLLKTKNQQLSTETERLREENEQLLTKGIIRWFLAGAGVLFIGWIMGKVSGRRRRQF